MRGAQRELGTAREGRSNSCRNQAYAVLFQVVFIFRGRSVVINDIYADGVGRIAEQLVGLANALGQRASNDKGNRDDRFAGKWGAIHVSLDDLGELVVLAIEDALNEVRAKRFKLFPAGIGVDCGVDELGFQATQRFAIVAVLSPRVTPSLYASGLRRARRVPSVDNSFLWAVLAQSVFPGEATSVQIRNAT